MPVALLVFTCLMVLWTLLRCLGNEKQRLTNNLEARLDAERRAKESAAAEAQRR